MEPLLFFVFLNLALMTALFGLLLMLRLQRFRNERRSRICRGQAQTIINDRSVQQLRRFLDRVGPQRRRQEDLLASLYFLNEGAPWIDQATANSTLIPKLIKQLDSNKPVERGRAALLIARLRLPQAVEALRPLLLDQDADIRHVAIHGIALQADFQAARALIESIPLAPSRPRVVEVLGGDWAVRYLMWALDEERFIDVRPDLIEALGLSRLPVATPRILQLLASEISEERVRACRALSRFEAPHPREVELGFMACLNDPFWPVRAQAARALRHCQLPEALPDLAALLDDDVWWVRAHAAHSLSQRGVEGMRILEEAVQSHEYESHLHEALTMAAARNLGVEIKELEDLE